MIKDIYKNKIAVGFVVYDSDNFFLERLIDIIKKNYFVYIFDNTPNKNFIRIETFKFDNVKYYTCGKNAGLGYGISTITSNAFYDGFKSLLFFDQDTYFTIDTIEYINQNASSINNYAAILFTSEKSEKSNYIQNRDLIINSGSLYNLNVLNLVKWHSIKYFVDGVDYDFCLRAKKAGYKIGYIGNTPGYDHITGQEDRTYSIFGKHLRLRAYKMSRIKDTVTSYLKLFFSSIFYLELKLASKFLFFLVVYCNNQVLVRFLNMFKQQAS